MIIRKNAGHLSPSEKTAFANALKALKASGVYDNYVKVHAIATAAVFPQEDAYVNGAHRGPAFLAWHRAMLLAFEKDLQQASNQPDMSIPYWDWTTDPYGKAVFTPEFMGGNGDPSNRYYISTGLFAKDWITVTYDVDGESLLRTGPLRRAFGEKGYIPKSSVVSGVMFGSTTYDSFPWNWDATPSFRADLENKLHDPIHMWVGGQMTNPSIAPNDPIFYLHHANMDRLWARWQDLYPTASYPTTTDLPPGQKLNDTLIGLTQTPAQVWDYKALGYTYDRAPGLRLLTGVNYAGFANEQASSLLMPMCLRLCYQIRKC